MVCNGAPKRALSSICVLLSLLMSLAALTYCQTSTGEVIIYNYMITHVCCIAVPLHILFSRLRCHYTEAIVCRCYMFIRNIVNVVTIGGIFLFKQVLHAINV